MSKKDIQDYLWQFPKSKRHFIDLVCSIQYTKDYTVITRTVEILEKYSFTKGDIAVTLLKGRKIYCMLFVQYVRAVHKQLFT